MQFFEDGRQSMGTMTTVSRIDDYEPGGAVCHARLDIFLENVHDLITVQIVRPLCEGKPAWSVLELGEHVELSERLYSSSKRHNHAVARKFLKPFRCTLQEITVLGNVLQANKLSLLLVSTEEVLVRIATANFLYLNCDRVCARHRIADFN